MDDETGSGFTVTDISYTDLSYPTGLEDFIYTATDGDGDTSSAHLYITSDSSLEGDFGDDLLTGDSGDNIIQGFDGADTLIGKGGLDILVGGDDADTFVFSANAGEGVDTIEDFNTVEDTLSFADLLDPENDLTAFVAEDISVVSVDGGDVTLTIHNQIGEPGTTEVTLAGIGDQYGDFSGSLADLADIQVATYTE